MLSATAIIVLAKMWPGTVQMREESESGIRKREEMLRRPEESLNV